jgi:hypothetical protein
MIHRRLFLGGLLAAAAGPAIVRASSLMPVVPRIILPSALAASESLTIAPFPIAYQWFRNGKPIPGATFASYVLPAYACDPNDIFHMEMTS